MVIPLLLKLLDLNSLGDVYFFQNTEDTRIIENVDSNFDVSVKALDKMTFTNDEEITKRQLLDYYGAYIFYSIFEGISSNNRAVISGQNADALFNLGPTEREIFSLIKRYLIKEKGNGFISFLIAFLTSIRNRGNFKSMKNREEIPIVVLDLHKYILLKREVIFGEYIEKQIIDWMHSSVYEEMYYYKINSYIYRVLILKLFSMPLN